MSPASNPHNPHDPHGANNPHATMQPALPKLSWDKLPAGWTDAGTGQMSVASFVITGDGGEKVTVAITPLGGLAGKETIIVNMWRQQVGQTELSEDEVAKQLSPVEIAGAPGRMFDVTGKAEGGAAMRIVTAMQHRDGTSWFFKLQGSDALVQAQKTAFIAFLKTVKFTGAPAAPAIAAGGGLPAMGSAPAAGAAPASASDWKIPAGWKSIAPGQMQVAKFSVPEISGANAEVMVSVFPNSTGGTLANVNRWRGQIGLPSATDIATLVKPLDEKIPDSALVDMTGTNPKTGKPARLVGAIVPRSGQWFFFKMLGDDAAVTAQKDAFIAFAKSPQ